jgi:hypothetical protein
LAPRAVAAAAQAHHDTCDVLSTAGWRVLPVKAGDDLARIWAASGVGTSAASGRAGRLSAVGGLR